MHNFDALRGEILERINRLEQELSVFTKESLDKIDAAEQSQILGSLVDIDRRLSSIEKKLAENDMDKEEGVSESPRIKR